MWHLAQSVNLKCVCSHVLGRAKCTLVFSKILLHVGFQVQEAVKQYNIQGIHPRLHTYLNQAVWLHMEGLVAQACKMASQRADLSR